MAYIYMYVYGVCHKKRLESMHQDTDSGYTWAMRQ